MLPRSNACQFPVQHVLKDPLSALCLCDPTFGCLQLLTIKFLITCYTRSWPRSYAIVAQLSGILCSRRWLHPGATMAIVLHVPRPGLYSHTCTAGRHVRTHPKRAAVLVRGSSNNKSDEQSTKSGRSRSLDTLDLLLGSTDPTPGKPTHTTRRCWLQQIFNRLIVTAEDTFDEMASASVNDIVSSSQQEAQAKQLGADSETDAEQRQQAEASTRQVISG